MFFAGGFEIVFSLMFVLVFGIILLNVFRGISQWNKNNHSPRLTVDATVVSKRQHTSHHHHKNHMSHSTSYYVTFNFILCHISSRKRRPHGTTYEWHGVRDVG